MNVTDVLKKTAAKKINKPATDMVEITVTPGLLTNHKMKYDAAKAAKADLELSEEELINAIKPSYVETLKNRYVNSARLSENDIEAIVSWKDAYSKIPTENADEIKGLVGDKFNDYFREVNEIVVKEDVASNEKLLEELITAVGPDTFSKYFDVAQKIVPKKEFTERRYKEFSAEQNSKLDMHVRQYKPSVRMKNK